MVDINQIPIIERRKIEALLVKNIYGTLCEKLGKEQAIKIIEETIIKSAIEHGKSFAKNLNHEADFNDFVESSKLWSKGDALEIEILSQDKKHYNYNVKRCEYAQMYKDMGLGEIGFLLSCNRDGAFCLGYNPKMQLKRTQTIMEGATHCDFRYSFNKEE